MLLIAALYDAVTGQSISAPSLNAKAKSGLQKIASELQANRGKSLVVSGSNNTAEQLLVHGINQALSNLGHTVTMHDASMQRQGNDKDVQSLLNDMNSGRIDVLIVMGANPVFDLPNGAVFGEAMEKVGTTIAMMEGPNETSVLCKYLAPVHHYLESWGDVEAKIGHVSMIQPTISPLFDTRQAELSLLTWAGITPQGDQPYYTYLKNSWQNEQFGRQSKHSSFNTFWDTCLHDGVIEMINDHSGSESMLVDPGSYAGQIGKPANSDLEISFYETVNLGGGEYADNPWLQELPDPVTRCVWGNYLSVPIGWDGDSSYTPFNGLEDGDRVDLDVNGNVVTCTVVRTFGQMEGTVAIGLGQGRRAGGKTTTGIGVDVNPLVVISDGNETV